MLAGIGATGRELLGEAEARLAAAGLACPRVDAEWLLAGMLGLGRTELYRAFGASPSEDVARRYRSFVHRRASGEPLQQILGWEGFRGLTIRVTPDVLIPRPETETLVDVALAALPSPRAGVRPLVIDAGTGSGCIACAIATERADVEVLAVDCSAAAAGVARGNVEALDLGRRIRIVVADLFAPVRSARADVIVANPPYLSDEMLAGAPIEVQEHEPRIALVAGADGLAVIRRLVSDAPRVLKSGGVLVLETAGGDQAPAVADLLRARWFTDVVVTNDLNGIGRFVAGRVEGVD